MMNIILILVIMLLALGAIFLAFRRSLETIYVLIAVFYVITNITAAKIVSVSINFFGLFDFNFLVSAAAPLYASLFLATDMIAERFNKASAYKGIWYGFSSQIILLAFGLLINLLGSGASDAVSGALNTIFSFTPRLVLGSLIAYLVSQNFDVWFFHTIRVWTKEKMPAVRNILSTLVSQFIDSFLVFLIAFYGVIDNWFAVMLSTYVIKVIVAICDTPFFLASRRLKNSQTEVQHV